MLLSKSERFLKEYEDFKTRIGKIQDPTKKAELTQLLNQLVSEVKAIDNKHGEINVAGRLPGAVNDLRDNLTNIRKAIINKLQGY